MSLPIKLGNVHYYLIAGKYSFAGELVITQRTLYFFPQVDLEAQRMKRAKNSYHVDGLAGAAVMYAASSALDAIQGSFLSQNGVWQEGISDEQFRKNADAHIAELKEKQSDKVFSESLPLPTRINADEVSNIKLGVTGKLSFIAQSDNHDFSVGWWRKRQLRDALWEAGFKV